MDRDLDKFLDYIIDSGMGGLKGEEFWPLKPEQILAYFDADFLLDAYARIQSLRQEGINGQKMAALFPSETMLLDFLLNFACIGFKVLNNFNIHPTSFEERKDFFQYVFRLIRIKNPNFLMDNQIKKYLSNKELESLLSQKLIQIDDANRRMLNSYKVACFSMNWSLQYDLFAAYGWSLHGPYPVRYQGEDLLLLVENYYDKKDLPHWPNTKKSPFGSTDLFYFYQPFDYEMQVFRLKTEENIGQKLRHVLIRKDGKMIRDPKKIGKLTADVMELTGIQSGYVESLDDRKKVEKSIAGVYYAYRKLFGEDWKRLSRKTINNAKSFGDKFIKEGMTEKAPLSRKQRMNKFDPRNNSF